LHRREEVYRREASALSLRGKIVILIDDGLATGATMRAAILALRQHGPAEVIVAVPVASRDTYDKFRHDGIDIVCVETPDDFQGVGQWYEDFRQTTDDEVRDLLAAAALLTPVALAEKN
jgi:predicted phosphoribosyltransferase